MGVSVESGPRSRRKSVNAELLLVPYIDLLTCMVAFLLITAVWTQLARLEVQQKGQGQSTGDEAPQTRVAVLVHDDGFALVEGDTQQPIPRARGEYNYSALADQLKKLKASFPDKIDIQVLSEDAIRFDILVKTMDAAMTSGFPNISLLDARTAS
jgi:biopolymer transport protein TolR